MNMASVDPAQPADSLVRFTPDQVYGYLQEKWGFIWNSKNQMWEIPI